MTNKQQAQQNVADYQASLKTKTNQQLLSEVDNIISKASKSGKFKETVTSTVLVPQAVIDEIRSAGFEVERDKQDYLFFTYHINWESND